MLEAWKRDLTHGARSLFRAPMFTIIAVLTLALAIGSNTAIFTVVNAVLLDPLQFREPDELVVIRGTAPGTDLEEEFGLGAEFYLTYKDNAPGLKDLAFVGNDLESDYLVPKDLGMEAFLYIPDPTAYEKKFGAYALNTYADDIVTELPQVFDKLQQRGRLAL